MSKRANLPPPSPVDARIPTDDLIPKTRRGRNQHSLAFQIPSASKDVYKYSFFPQTIRDWNNLPESLISSSELSDDSVSKFTSLVRARGLISPSQSLVKDCQFGVSPVNYSDSDTMLPHHVTGELQNGLEVFNNSSLPSAFSSEA